MNKKYLKFFLIYVVLVIPLMTFAATNQNLGNVVQVIIGYLNIALVLMMALSIVMFTFYVIRYFVMPNEERKNANLYVMYSIIGFFVIFSFWGIVNIVQNSFGLGNTTNTPASWASFSNIFPGGSSSSGNSLPSGTFQTLNGTQSTNNPTNVFAP